MSFLASVVRHLPISKLRKRFRQADDACLKTHLQVILLRAKGRSSAEVAQVCGYKTDWVRQLVRRYNEHGPEALEDGRSANGRKRLLSDRLLGQLRNAVLNTKPEEGGLWTGPKVASWMTQKLNRPVSPQTAWDYLQHLRLSKQTPRPRNARASVEAQAAFKKNSADG